MAVQPEAALERRDEGGPLLVEGEGAVRTMENRPAICSPRVPESRLATSESACISIKAARCAPVADGSASRPWGGDRAPGVLAAPVCGLLAAAVLLRLGGGEQPLGAVPVPAGRLGRCGWFYAAGPAIR